MNYRFIFTRPHKGLADPTLNLIVEWLSEHVDGEDFTTPSVPALRQLRNIVGEERWNYIEIYSARIHQAKTWRVAQLARRDDDFNAFVFEYIIDVPDEITAIQLKLIA